MDCTHFTKSTFTAKVKVESPPSHLPFHTVRILLPPGIPPIPIPHAFHGGDDQDNRFLKFGLALAPMPFMTGVPSPSAWVVGLSGPA